MYHKLESYVSVVRIRIVKLHMKHRALLVLLAGLVALSSNTWALCEQEHFGGEVKLKELPLQVQKILKVDEPGYWGIAEKDQEFNATDVVRPNLPMRRLAIAIKSPSCALTAVEQGGRGYSVKLTGFEFREGAWQKIADRTVFKVPQTSAELPALLFEAH